MGVHRKIARLIFAAVWLALPDCISALTLIDVYRAAAANDPYLIAAFHEYQAAAEERNIGRGYLLPDITYVAKESDNSTKRKAMGLFGPINDRIHYKSSSSGVYFRQPLISLERYAMYQQGELQGEAAEKQFQTRRQEFAVRIVTAYFDALVAKSEVALAGMQLEVAQEKLKQAQKQFAEGEAIKLDVDAAMTRFQLAEIQSLTVQDKFQKAVDVLRELTGLELIDVPLISGLHDLNEAALAVEAVDELAVLQGPRVQERDLEVSVAKQNINRLESSYFPTLDLTASYSKSNQEGITTLGQKYRTNSVGLELQWPILEGGRKLASTHKAQSQYLQATQELRIERSLVKLEAESDYRVAKTAGAKIRILNESADVQRRNLEAIQMEYRHGVRTLVDVAEAKKEILHATYMLADELRNFVVALVKLDGLMGKSQEDRIVWAQRLIESSISSLESIETGSVILSPR